jgi:hypothetical protein
MSYDRAHILNMLAAGDITAEQAAAYLRDAPAEPQAPQAHSTQAARPAGAAGRWLRVRVTDTTTGRAKVNVNVPLGLVSAALKLGAHYAPEVAGIDMQEILKEVQSGAQGRLVDVEDLEDGERVEVFVE